MGRWQSLEEKYFQNQAGAFCRKKKTLEVWFFSWRGLVTVCSLDKVTNLRMNWKLFVPLILFVSIVVARHTMCSLLAAEYTIISLCIFIYFFVVLTINGLNVFSECISSKVSWYIYWIFPSEIVFILNQLKGFYFHKNMVWIWIQNEMKSN